MNDVCVWGGAVKFSGVIIDVANGAKGIRRRQNLSSFGGQANAVGEQKINFSKLKSLEK